MDEPTRARLVGASVFALVGVIVLPWLFSDPVDPRRGIQSRFAGEAPAVTELPNRPFGRRPHRPEVQPVTLATQAPAPSATARPQPPPSKPPSTPRPRPTQRPPPPKKPVVDATPRWRLQLASYGQAENAQKFADELRKLGHEPRVLKARSQGRTVWRVQLQLSGSETQARQVQEKLNSRFGIRSLLSSL